MSKAHFSGKDTSVLCTPHIAAGGIPQALARTKAFRIEMRKNIGFYAFFFRSA